MAVGRPAVLGGEPVFAETVPIVRPVVPRLEDVANDIGEALASGQVTRAKQMRAFEEEVAAATGAAHALAVANCTTGLMLSLRGLAPGSEAILPSFTFMATAAAIVWNGLRPVFAESDPETMNVIPESVASLVTPRTKAIVIVHDFGSPAAVEALQEIADKHGLRLVFDAAHGLGAQHDGKPIGGFGDAEVFSLSPTKLVIGCEGGVVTTNSKEMAERIRVGREYGNPGNYDSEFVGLSGRLSELHSIVARWSLARLPGHVARRHEIVARVKGRLAQLPGLRFQRIAGSDRSTYKDLTIAVTASAAGLSRDRLAATLKAEGVDTRAYYRPAVHQMTCYSCYAQGALPLTEQLTRECLSLPIHSQMPDATVDGICTAIERIWHYRDELGATA